MIAHTSSHSVQFYETENFLNEAIGRYLHDGLSRGAPALVIARPAQCSALTDYLSARDWDCGQARKDGRLTLVDASETIEMFMVNGMPDERLFANYIGNLLLQIATASHKLPVQAYGEMVHLLWQRGQHAAALRVEELWNEISRQHSFNLLCAYALSGMVHADERMLETICHHHDAVAPVEVRPANGDAEPATLEIQLIQKRIRELELELAQLKAGNAN